MHSSHPTWASPDMDLTRPSAARVYDAALGGTHNFPADRAVLDQLRASFPFTPRPATDNRSFLRRAVLHCTERGITQFLDLGSGVPTVGNVHEVVREVRTDARVVYVDHDPVAVAHAERMLQGDDTTGVLQADIRYPESVLNHPEARRLLDFTQPVAVLMVAMMHYLDSNPEDILRHYRSAMRPGSYLVVSHLTADGYPEEMRQAAQAFDDTTDPMTLRTHAQVTALLDDFEIVEPGVVYCADWRPDPHADSEGRSDESATYGAVGYLAANPKT